MRQVSLAALLAGALLLAACSPGAILPTVPPPPSGPSPTQNAVGSALQVREDLVEAQAKAWHADAQLIGIQGTGINGDGVNFATAATWVFTYRSAGSKETATFTASTTGLQGPVPVTDRPQAAGIGGASIDSDQAVQKYKASVKDRALDRFSVTLDVIDGVPVWQVVAMDSLGARLGSGSVNASTGSVSVA